MTLCYKLTRKDLRCYGGYRYEVGVPRTVEHYTGVVCSSGVLHAYRTAEDAVFFDPIHSGYLPEGLLWEAEYSGQSVDDGSKLGVETLRLVHAVEPPTLTVEELARRAIEAAMKVYQGPAWVQWSERWLAGKDKSKESVEDAWMTAEAAWMTADEAAEREAAWSARAAARAASHLDEWTAEDEALALAVAWSARAAARAAARASALAAKAK